MREIRFQSKWFERCLKDFLGIKDRAITDKDVQEIKYLFVTTTHDYGLGFAKTLPSELFQTCAFDNAGDEWAFECIEDTGKYQTVEEFLEYDSSKMDVGRKVHTIRLKRDVKRFKYEGSLVSYKLAQRVMRDFEKNIKEYGAYEADREGLDEDEVTHDHKLLIPEDFCCLTNLEVLRLMSCQTEVHSLKFLDVLSKLRILEIGEVFLDDLDGLENLIGLDKLCIWSN